MPSKTAKTAAKPPHTRKTCALCLPITKTLRSNQLPRRRSCDLEHWGSGDLPRRALKSSGHPDCGAMLQSRVMLKVPVAGTAGQVASLTVVSHAVTL